MDFLEKRKKNYIFNLLKIDNKKICFLIKSLKFLIRKWIFIKMENTIFNN